jgi:hypothetical protein
METSELLAVLERQREREQDFAANWRDTPGGWTGGQLFAHLAAWRERLLHCLATGEPPPPSADEVNDPEIAAFRAEKTATAAARADDLTGRLMAAVAERGPDSALRWYSVNTLGEAVLRNTVNHPAQHLLEHLLELSEIDRAADLAEGVVNDYGRLRPGPALIGGPLYNLAVARVKQDRLDQARAALEDALRARPDLAEASASDPDLAPLRS